MNAPRIVPNVDTPGLAGGARSTGAAVVPDLYKHQADPAAEGARLRAEARKLGMAFCVFFSLIIGGISLLLNGAHKRGHVITIAAGPGRSAKEATLDPEQARRWVVVWSGGQRTSVERVDLEATKDDDVPGVEVARLARVRVQALDEAGRRAFVAALYTSPVQGAHPTGVELDGGAAQAAPSFQHAVRTARLAGLVPTRVVISVGAVMGLLGLLVPALLVPFYKFWMGYVAAPLGWFNTRLILGLVFFLMFTPMALLLWVRRKLAPETDPLRRAELPGGSYWKRREQPRPRDHFERTF